MEIKVRKMTMDDSEFVAELEKVCFPFPWKKESIELFMNRSESRFFVAEVDGKPAGYSEMITVLDEGQVCNIAVSPEFRRMGIGMALTGKLIETGRELNLSVIMLEVRAHNEKAIGLYEKLGFEKVGVRKKFYSNPTDDGVLYNYYFKKEQ